MAAGGILGQGYTTICHFAKMKCSKCTFGSKGKGKIVGYKYFMGSVFNQVTCLALSKSDATESYPVFSISKPFWVSNTNATVVTRDEYLIVNQTHRVGGACSMKDLCMPTSKISHNCPYFGQIFKSDQYMKDPYTFTSDLLAILVLSSSRSLHQFSKYSETLFYHLNLFFHQCYPGVVEG